MSETTEFKLVPALKFKNILHNDDDDDDEGNVHNKHKYTRSVNDIISGEGLGQVWSLDPKE